MGAGGSTAASCSSLDLTNRHHRQQNHHYYKQNSQQLQYHEQRMLKYRKQAKVPVNNKSAHLLKQSNSYFDLTANNLLHNQDSHRPQQASSQAAGNHWLDHGPQQLEAYNLSNADIVGARPVMVLPSKPPISPALHLSSIAAAKKSNAGVASRILQQRQQQRSNELKKFSDSLPSLNQILLPQPHHQQPQQQHMQRIDHHQHSRQHPPNQNKKLKQSQFLSPTNQLTYDNNSQQTLASQQAGAIRNLHGYNQQATCSSGNLVSKNKEIFYQQPWLEQQQRPHNRFDADEQQHCLGGSQKQQLMKRATSLSSLHNLNQPSSHHQNHHQQQADMVNQSRSHHALSSANQTSPQQYGRGIKQNNQIKSFSRRPESTNSNYTPSQVRCDNNTKNQQCDHRHSSQLKPTYKQQYQMQHGQPVALAKKVLKYKQQAPNTSGPYSKSNRYKSKQQQTQQQGCPVLPPLPRSQSLHELIQLRATENGQRMRTTGTLRGPLNGDGPSSKVNLVAELLESRRQQRQLGDRQETNRVSPTRLSQSSSTDDGIHDVSLTGGESHSAGDNQLGFVSSSNNKEGNSTTSRPDSDTPQSERQLIFKKQAAISNSNRTKRFSHISSNGQDVNADKAKRHVDSSDREAGLPQDNLNDPRNHKSTLKRSLSHSALHQTSANNLDGRDQDGDESDDLNELAKFLYQFKQRQAASAAATSNPAKSNVVQHLGSRDGHRMILATKGGLANIQPELPVSPSTSSDRSGSRHNHNHHHATANLQSSPNSTTSSSGFASSTCTSNSLSSSDSTEEASKRKYEQNLSFVDSHKDAAASKKLARKKYPAPPRPDQVNGKKQSSCTASSCDGQTSNGGSQTRCPISGKLKLSSSLLSIVDEYQSTLQSSGRLSPSLIASSTNLTSVLMSGVSPSGETKQNQALRVESSRKDQLLRKRENDGSMDREMQVQRQQQLEQLKRYTQMRQISQSELALNHLTASPISHACSPNQVQQSPSRDKKDGGCEVVGRGSGGHQRGTKPYASRLFKLIRRISDKSEVTNANGRNSNVRGSSGRSASSTSTTNGSVSSGRAGNAVGGPPTGKLCQSRDCPTEGELKVINQTETNCQHERRHRGCTNPPNGQDQQAETLVDGKLLHSNGCKKSCLSESLCDLNFDCDFELIKNCGSTHTSEQSGPQPVRPSCKPLLQEAGGPLKLQASDPRVARDFNDGEGQRWRNNYQAAERKQQQAVNLPLGENNWKLVSATSLATSTNTAASSAQLTSINAGCEESRYTGHNHQNSNNVNQQSRQRDQSIPGGREKLNESSKLPPAASHKFYCSQADATSQLTTVQSTVVANKSKWSASGWLMNSSNGANKSKSKQEADVQPSRSYLAKLIPTSKTQLKANARAGQQQHDNETGKTPALSANSEMINEADQLLVELDLSLDLVSANGGSGTDPFTHKHPASWWHANVDDRPMMHSPSFDKTFNRADLLSESDDNDDADYASINQAMINETFDVGSSKLMVAQDKSNQDSQLATEPGSPSDSFTFSPANSPPASPKGSGENCKQLRLGDQLGIVEIRHECSERSKVNQSSHTAVASNEDDEHAHGRKFKCNHASANSSTSPLACESRPPLQKARNAVGTDGGGNVEGALFGPNKTEDVAFIVKRQEDDRNGECLNNRACLDAFRSIVCHAGEDNNSSGTPSMAEEVKLARDKRIELPAPIASGTFTKMPATKPSNAIISCRHRGRSDCNEQQIFSVDKQFHETSAGAQKHQNLEASYVKKGSVQQQQHKYCAPVELANVAPSETICCDLNGSNCCCTRDVDPSRVQCTGMAVNSYPVEEGTKTSTTSAVVSNDRSLDSRNDILNNSCCVMSKQSLAQTSLDLLERSACKHQLNRCDKSSNRPTIDGHQLAPVFTTTASDGHRKFSCVQKQRSACSEPCCLMSHGGVTCNGAVEKKSSDNENGPNRQEQQQRQKSSTADSQSTFQGQCSGCHSCCCQRRSNTENKIEPDKQQFGAKSKLSANSEVPASDRGNNCDGCRLADVCKPKSGMGTRANLATGAIPVAAKNPSLMVADKTVATKTKCFQNSNCGETAKPAVRKDLHEADGFCRSQLCNNENKSSVTAAAATTDGPVCSAHNASENGASSKLIIRKASCQCSSAAADKDDSPKPRTTNAVAAAVSAAAIKAVPGRQALVGNNRARMMQNSHALHSSLSSTDTAASSSASCLLANAMGSHDGGSSAIKSDATDSKNIATKQAAGSVEAKCSNSKAGVHSQAAVSYYHYSHEMGKFAPTSNGCDSMDKSGVGREIKQSSCGFITSGKCSYTASSGRCKCCSDDELESADGHLGIRCKMAISSGNSHSSSGPLCHSKHLRCNEDVNVTAKQKAEICVSGNNLSPRASHPESARAMVGECYRCCRMVESEPTATADVTAKTLVGQDACGQRLCSHKFSNSKSTHRIGNLNCCSTAAAAAAAAANTATAASAIAKTTDTATTAEFASHSNVQMHAHSDSPRFTRDVRAEKLQNDKRTSATESGSGGSDLAHRNHQRTCHGLESREKSIQMFAGCSSIHRSNSELVTSYTAAAERKNNSHNNGHHPRVNLTKSHATPPPLSDPSSEHSSSGGRKEGNVLFGKLRNSLLNQKVVPLGSSKMLASSQVSLVNYYSSANNFLPNMMTPKAAQSMLRDDQQRQQLAANKFDDNFILKRKTPNAGLKSQG